ncbi:hypothetical protein MLD38_037181 [Melastoma candidum]|uniref:Uncharacterized protein n=1 Tax=Melastoma candidum TaxID=119954 RepID=A0ACB9LNV7_9MYRT|nr:hypothetical protein MLD38_037181 [Melastoma candidum]
MSLLRLLVLLLLCLQVTPQTYDALACLGHGENVIERNSQNNLDRLLLHHSDRVRSSFFYNGTLGEPPNTIYGFFLCRPDIGVDECKSCVSSATGKILLDCPTQKGAMIWYDECQVRFSNQSFFTILEMKPAIEILDTTNFTYPDMLGEVLVTLLQNVTDSSISSSELYATSQTNVNASLEVEVRAQCRPDLSKQDCRSCLTAVTDKLRPFRGKRYAQIFLPSCYVQFKIIAWPSTVQLNPTSHTIYGVSERKLAVKWHIIAAVAVACLILIMVGLRICIKWKMKKAAYKKSTKDLQLLDLGNSFVGNIPNTDFLGEKPMNSQDIVLMRVDSIRLATNNFSDESELGKGGFGPVYKGTLTDGRDIAVKRLYRTSGQGLVELKNEVTLIARLQHRNLVKLLGCCLDKQEKLLIYEYMPNKSLDFFLFDQGRSWLLDWNRRFNIINGIARGLQYLHEDSRLRVIHRDLKASNILLDHEMNPKISDFGMARIFSVNQDVESTTRVVGTYGYMAPEYVMGGRFSVKSDVFSFGIILLEILSGRKNSSFHCNHELGESLPTFAWNMWISGRAFDLIDGFIKESCDVVQALKCIHVGLLCIQQDPADRPTMSLVIRMLGEDMITLPEPLQPVFFVSKPSTVSSDTNQTVGISVNEVTITDILPR